MAPAAGATPVRAPAVVVGSSALVTPGPQPHSTPKRTLDDHSPDQVARAGRAAAREGGAPWHHMLIQTCFLSSLRVAPIALSRIFLRRDHRSRATADLAILRRACRRAPPAGFLRKSSFLSAARRTQGVEAADDVPENPIAKDIEPIGVTGAVVVDESGAKVRIRCSLLFRVAARLRRWGSVAARFRATDCLRGALRLPWRVHRARVPCWQRGRDSVPESERGTAAIRTSWATAAPSLRIRASARSALSASFSRRWARRRFIPSYPHLMLRAYLGPAPRP